jgi:hypothetical protein
VLDGTGQEQLVHLLDKACRGEAFDEEEIATANLDRTAIIQPVRLGLAAASSIPCTSKTTAAVNPRHKARKRFPRGHACRRVGQPGLPPKSPDRTQGGRRNIIFVKQLHIDRRRPGRPRLAIPLPRSPAPPQPIAQKAPPPAPSIRAATSPSHPIHLPGLHLQQRLLAPHPPRNPPAPLSAPSHRSCAAPRRRPPKPPAYTIPRASSRLYCFSRGEQV